MTTQQGGAAARAFSVRLALVYHSYTGQRYLSGYRIAELLLCSLSCLNEIT